MPTSRLPRVTRRSLAVLLLAGAAVGAVLAVRAPTDVAVAAPAGPLTTPLWSVRRVPGPVVAGVNGARLDAASRELQAALSGEAARWGSACFTVERAGTVVASRDADLPLMPASTQKLLIAAAALDRLGADSRYETRAVAAEPPRGGSLDRLWFVGSGDPVIRTAEYMDAGVSTPLEALADSIVAAGVRRIGTIVADDSRYDTQRFVPSWSPTYRTDFDVGPLGALTVTEGIVLVSGKPVMTDDPAAFAAGELARVLRARGVTVDATAVGTAPPDSSRIATVTSQPLSTIVTWMLRTSNNLTAELLTKELGLRVNGAGTTAAGVSAIQATLRALGVSLDGQVMIDGSGLDRGNRLTCGMLRSVVDLGDRPGFAGLRAAFPSVGVASNDGRVRAKGGYLPGVSGLAGVVGDELRFSFLANGNVPANANAAVIDPFVSALLRVPFPAELPVAIVPEPLGALLAPPTADRPRDRRTPSPVPATASAGAPQGGS